MLAMFPFRPEEALLQTWFVESGLDVSLVFHAPRPVLHPAQGRPAGGNGGGHAPLSAGSAGAELAGVMRSFRSGIAASRILEPRASPEAPSDTRRWRE